MWPALRRGQPPPGNAVVLRWNEKLNTGIAAIDRQHQALIRVANRLEAAASWGTALFALDYVIGELSTYAAEHFSQEDALFSNSDYPKVEEHRAEHRGFIERVESFRKELAAGGDLQPSQLHAFLSDWIIHHIEELDMGYVSYIQRPT